MKEPTRFLLTLLDAEKLDFISLRLFKSYLDGEEDPEILHLSNALCCAASYLEKLKTEDEILSEGQDAEEEILDQVSSTIFINPPV